MKRFRAAIVATHPIQYYVPIYRELARRREIDIEVLFAHRQDPAGQARAGFGVRFDWDVVLSDGYRHRFLTNRARRPDATRFFGCHTPELSGLIERGEYDAVLVHGWYSRSYLQAIRACWRAGVPVLVRGDSHLETPRTAWKRWAKEPLYRWFIPRFDGYLYVGKHAQEYYVHYGADPHKMYFSPHCVDNEFFAEQAATVRGERARIRARWGVPEQSLCFVFLGKFTPIKRPQDFVVSVARAAERTSVHGLMVGDGPLRGQLEQMTKETAAPVTLTGFLNQTEVAKAYVAADVVVLPGRETWGLVVNEGMATGLPAIVSDAAGCGPDLVVPGETGAVFPCGDTAALAEQMVLLARDADRVARMGERARRHVADYSVERAADGVVAAVCQLATLRAQGNAR